MRCCFGPKQIVKVNVILENGVIIKYGSCQDHLEEQAIRICEDLMTLARPTEKQAEAEQLSLLV